MKKGILILIIGLLAQGGYAQVVDVHKIIDNRYPDVHLQSFIYQANPQVETADLEWREQLEALYNGQHLPPEINAVELTSWVYEEQKFTAETLFAPISFRYYTVDENNGNRLLSWNNYEWDLNSNDWYLTSERFIYSSEGQIDSTISYSYQATGTTPYSGNRFRYIHSPADGADYEYYIDMYDRDQQQFVNFMHYRTYRDEEEQDTLTLSSRWVESSQRYRQVSYLRYEYSESYEIEEYRYYDISTVDDRILIWNFDRTDYDAEGRTDRMTSRGWNFLTQQLEPTDSTKYNYFSNGVEAQNFEWVDTAWVYSENYRSYDHESTINPGYRITDSVVVQSMVYDPESGLYVPEEVTSKQVYEYDANERIIDSKLYTTMTTELVLAARWTYRYAMINGLSRSVEREYYSYDVATSAIYLSSELKTYHMSNGNYKGSQTFNFNPAGDTTGGARNMMERLNENETDDWITTYFSWEVDDKDWVLNSYYIQRYDDIPTVTDRVYQSNTYDVNGTVNREIRGYGDYPGIFNDGPVFLSANNAVASDAADFVFNEQSASTYSPGDTLLFYVSGINPDRTIPEITVTGMPATATYNPDTRRFFWIVDDLNPGPMTYSTTYGNLTISTTVDFREGPLTTEIEKQPVVIRSYELDQNYPNPFNPTTMINFELGQAGPVSLEVFTITGQRVARLLTDQQMSAGSHSVTFDGGQFSSGVYLYRLYSRNYIKTKKMTLMK